MMFDELGLRAELLRAVAEQGYDTATPIQQKTIPAVLAGSDVLAGAQTGTGKTAGFTLPLLQRLQAGNGKSKRRQVRALILTPTRELAAQVGESVKAYARYLPVKTGIVFGGVNINPQIQTFRRGIDVVVATPGRLLDHMNQRTVDLSHVEILVLDEADRMLDMGFIRDIRKIIDRLPNQRQNLLFSATFSKEIRRLAADLLDKPLEINVASSNVAAEKINQIVWSVDQGRKRELLSHRIGAENWQQVLVFTRTKHGADRLCQQLVRDGLSATAIHGNKSQAARTRALADFKSGKVRILVATDVAARGLDINRLPCVVNYELPHVPEDYVHRIGRTARAGQSGQAVSLVCHEESKQLAAVERLLKRKIERFVIPGYEPDTTAKPRRPVGQAPKRRAKPKPAGNKAARSGQKSRRNRPNRAGNSGSPAR